MINIKEYQMTFPHGETHLKMPLLEGKIDIAYRFKRIFL
jgi:hypothetical protein